MKCAMCSTVVKGGSSRFPFCEDEDLCWACGYDTFVTPELKRLRALAELVPGLVKALEHLVHAIPSEDKCPKCIECDKNLAAARRVMEEK